MFLTIKGGKKAEKKAEKKVEKFSFIIEDLFYSNKEKGI